MSRKNSKNTLGDLNEFLKAQQDGKDTGVEHQHSHEQFVEQKPSTLVAVDRFHEEQEKALPGKEASRELSEQLLETARERNLNWMSLWVEVFAQAGSKQAAQFTRDVVDFQFSVMENSIRSSMKFWESYDPAVYVKMWGKQ